MGAVRLAPEVDAAIRAGQAVVGLESSVFAQGLPAPHNADAAKRMEAAIRESGAVPAITAVALGQAVAGLAPDELARFLGGRLVVTASARDVAPASAAGIDAATTVAGALLLCHVSGISVFATGGIGGVHRDASISGDVSADLTALSRIPIAVVCAGAKAILDLPRTVEMLETLGVPVFGLRTNECPAFYRRSSGLSVDSRMDTVEELASAFRTHFAFGLGTGVLIANPIPAADELPAETYERALETALADAERQRLRGRDVTPFLL